MKKIGFVTPWFDKNIQGGAEMALRGITEHLHSAGIDVEILTTCVKEFASDWNVNYHKPGDSIINGISTKRFTIRKRDIKKFDAVNYKLINNIPITKDEELIFITEMINSPELYRYIEKNKDQYEVFVYIPYMFGTTYFGIKVCPEKAVMVPCFHDESYMYLSIFKELYSKTAGMIFNAKPECNLANKVYNLSAVKQCIPGLGVETDLKYDENKFRKKYKIEEPFIIYAGRKDVGKNVDLLIEYFSRYKNRHTNNLKLIFIGGGSLSIPSDIHNDVIDLGFVSIQDKYDAFSAAVCLCQPSKNESFSLVIMESWLCRRPVLVHSECEVTKYFAKNANAGLYFRDYYEFEGCVNYYLDNPVISDTMGEIGREYVLNNFDWKVVTKKYIDFFERIKG